ncbi:hypothetical protein [Rhodovulum adriaticum]|uniref:Arginine transporter n=1 Tax=Rhodovulum adriaticum TaxID=35804 RepID=A0A4R2NL75_RHOAD|nr:hypothetical protein [Rhodovulum adriaticum]MBK1635177.1 hypothetical protein [Rhodovulum adriaticum]TCP22290.1 hypothetical protein EV656_10799 [Rhodovulum adriaticum]
MKTILTAAVLAVCATPVAAGPIERACLGSDRPGATRGLCACIQQAADLTLSQGDQRRAVRFFVEPHEAQVVRQSDRASDAEFWQRYKRFGKTAEAYCG